MDRTRRQPCDWILYLHPFVELPSVRGADGVGDVKQEISGDCNGFLFVPIFVRSLDQIKKLDGHRCSAHKNVPLSENLDCPAGRIRFERTEVLMYKGMRLLEERLESFGNFYGFKRSVHKLMEMPLVNSRSLLLTPMGGS